MRTGRVPYRTIRTRMRRTDELSGCALSPVLPITLSREADRPEPPLNLGPVRLFVLDANLTTVMGRSFHVSPGSFNAPVPGDPSTDSPLPYDEAWTTFHLIISLAKIMRSTVGTLVRPPSPLLPPFRSSDVVRGLVFTRVSCRSVLP